MKKLATLLLMLFFCYAYTPSVASAVPMSLESQEQLDSTKKALSILDQMQAKLNADVAETESQCMKATGAVEFCKCISWKTPGNFVTYVTIISKTKEELNYDLLNNNNKLLVDNVRKARAACVK